MPNPDMITQYLASRGAAPSARNANLTREHFAANPDLLDRRAMGLPGGLDDNSAVLDAVLDKHVAESMPAPAGTVTVGELEKVDSGVPPPDKRGPMIKGPTEVAGTASTGASRQGGYGPGPSPSRQGNYGNTAPTEGSNFTAGVGTGQQVGPTQRSGITEMLLGLLGAGAGAYGLSKMAGRGAEAPQATGPLPGTEAAAATAAPVDTTDPAVMRQRMQAEIDAENDAMMRQMEEQARTQRNQKNAQETMRAAKRATGRR